MLVIDGKIVIAHMKKCGGTSVCKGLIEILEPDRLEYFGYTTMGEKKSAVSRRRGKLWKHSSAAEIVEKLPQKREDLTVYLISLRPWWQRVGSFFFHARRYNKIHGTYKWIEGMNFSSFLRSKYIDEVEQLDVFSKNGAVDFFVDYTRLSDWYTSFASDLGHPEGILPSYNLGNSTEHDYRDLFSEDDMKLMSARFAGEIHMLSQLQPVGSGHMWTATGERITT